MKVTDLMVGDWVSYCGFYNKVIYIGQKVSMYNGKGTEFTTDPEYIRPIPLTEEILVKNGFEKTILSSDYNKYDFEHFIIRWDKGFGYWFGDGEYTIDFIYVHELQHLLRLCGIEKELVID